jgi:hypothetical protein
MKWRKWSWRIAKWFFGIAMSLFLLISLIIYLYKDDIIDYAVTELNKNLKADVEVEKIDITFWSTFPNLSLDFNHVFIQDALPKATRRDTLLYTEQIRLKFDPFDIWKEKYHVKRIDIKPGTIQLKVNERGQVNYSILEDQKSDESTEFKLTLESIHVDQMRFIYKNKEQASTYKSFVRHLELKGEFTQDVFDLRTVADLQLQRIEHGVVPFVLNQPAQTEVNLHIDKIKQSYSINNGKLILSGIPFDFNVFADTGKVKASIQSENIPLQDIADRLAMREVKEVKKLKGSGNGYFKFNLLSKLRKDAFPEITCSFGINNGKITEPVKNLVLNQIHLKGYYSTLKGRGQEELSINHIRFNTISGPFSGELFMRNFDQPSYKGRAKGSVDLGVLQAILKLPKIDLLDGTVRINTKFACETRILNNKKYVDIAEGSGDALLSNVSFQLERDSRKFYGIHGNLVLDRSAASLEDLSVKLGESDLKLNGSFNNIDQFLQDENNLEIQVIAESKSIHLKDFTNEIPPTPATSAQTRDWMLPSMIQGDVKLDVGTIQMNQHVFTQINGEMNVGNRTVAIQKLHGITANATVRGSVRVVETNPEYFELETNLSSKDIYFKPIFREWNNFDQTIITENNISGRAEAILDLKAPFFIGRGILKDEIIAQIQLKVVNGQLKNVETFKVLTNDLKTAKTKLILKQNEIDALQNKLNDIQFETLENTIYIKNSTIIVPKMTINSNAIDVTIDGEHTFNNAIDYHFSFRFRELKQLKDESEFGIVEDDGTGMKIFVRMHGTLDKPIVEWDKTARKEQTKENREAAKKEAISILKSEFGLFKKDTTVQKYQPKKQEREVIKIDFGKEEEVNPYEEKKKIQEEKKGLKKMAEKLKEKNKKEQEKETFTIE